MSNTNLTIDMITKEALRIAHEKATFLTTIDRQYDEAFGKEGGKIGNALRIRLPNQYTRTQGSRVADVQDTETKKVTLTMATQDHVAMRFNSAELYTDIDTFSKKHIEPAMATLISGVESDVLRALTKKVYNTVGSAGTPITTLDVPGKARARLNQCLAPKDMNRAVQLDSVTMAGMVNGMAAYFAPQAAVSERFTEGFVKRTSMADYYENERVYTHTVGSDVTVNTSAAAAVTDGGTNITMNSTDGNINAGDVFTVAGVYACHPETKAALPYLQQYVANAASTGAVTVSPPTILTGPYQNVCSASGAALATTDFNSKTMTFVGTANASYVQPIMYHKEAFAFVTGDLPLMGGADRCSRQSYEGISLRVWQDGDIRNDELITRIDILYGYEAIRPQWACRMVGAAVA